MHCHQTVPKVNCTEACEETATVKCHEFDDVRAKSKVNIRINIRYQVGYLEPQYLRIFVFLM